jgi:hypothetical protein
VLVVAGIDWTPIELPRPAFKPMLPPKDGESRLYITSVIRNGDHAPTIYFAGTIAPDVVRVMVLDQGGLRNQRLLDIGKYLIAKLNQFCDVALGPPGVK